jgi:hypothetical protein
VEKVDVNVGKARVEPAGDAVVAYELEIKVRSKVGFEETRTISNQTVRVGRALVSFTFESQLDSLTDLTPSLIDASLRRLRAAMGLGGNPSPPQGTAFGEVAVGAKGAKVTVFAYTAPAQVRFSLSPSSAGGPPDGIWATVDAQVCAGETSEVTASTSAFKLVFPDNTRAESKFGAEPAFPSYSTIRQGDCVRGLVTFAVSPSVQPASVLYESSGSEAPTLRWSVA